MELISLSCPPRSRQTLHHIYHTMGEIQIPYCPPGIHRVGRWLHQSLRWHRGTHPECIRHPAVVTNRGGGLQTSNRMARHMRQQWGHTQPCQIPIRPGFDITPTTVKSCQKYVRAISDFPTPKNLMDVRSWFGLVNQVSYAFSMTAAMTPFRELLKPTQKFEWTASHDAAFRESKRVIAQEIQHGVEIFDKNKPTCLATDWSKDGVGYWLFQKHHPKTSSVAKPAGGSHWWDRDLHTQPNHDMPPSRERHCG